MAKNLVDAGQDTASPRDTGFAGSREGDAPGHKAAALAARLDRLPASRSIWRLALLIALGAGFEFYELFFTAYVAPGMIRSGLFEPESLGILAKSSVFAFSGFGTFVFSTFAGLWVGTLLVSQMIDHFGRRRMFMLALVWYLLCAAVMAFQTSGLWLNAWRFLGGIGLGVELSTVDTYLGELMPREIRGRAFAWQQTVSYLAVPIVAFLAWQLVPLAPLGIDGWRWVVLIGSVGAIFVWFLLRRLPESPRWLARRGRIPEAEAIIGALERRIEAETGRPLPPPGLPILEDEGRGSFGEMFKRPYLSRTIMFSVYNFASSVGYYGFSAWVPTLLIGRGISVTQSLAYAFVIAIANPFGPLLATLFADRLERKWQLGGALIGMMVSMAAFSQMNAPATLILMGVCFILAANIQSYSYHAYQAELFPTRIRGRAIGFVNSWFRLSSAFAGLLIGYLLQFHGVTATALFIALALLGQVVIIAAFGPRTTGRALEQISR
jgi:putative MFS transporter